MCGHVSCAATQDCHPGSNEGMCKSEGRPTHSLNPVQTAAAWRELAGAGTAGQSAGATLQRLAALSEAHLGEVEQVGAGGPRAAGGVRRLGRRKKRDKVPLLLAQVGIIALQAMHACTWALGQVCTCALQAVHHWGNGQSGRYLVPWWICLKMCWDGPICSSVEQQCACWCSLSLCEGRAAEDGEILDVDPCWIRQPVHWISIGVC